MKKIIEIFDLDGTVICSKHRVKHALLDGVFNVFKYITECNTPELIAKDQLLPLAFYMQKKAHDGSEFAILTARCLDSHDIEFLIKNGLINGKTLLISRQGIDKAISELPDAPYKVKQFKRIQAHYGADNHFILYEDMPDILEAMHDQGVTCIDAIELNRELKAEPPEFNNVIVKEKLLPRLMDSLFVTGSFT